MEKFRTLCETFSFPYSIKLSSFLSFLGDYLCDSKNKKLRKFSSMCIALQRILFPFCVLPVSFGTFFFSYSLLWKQFLMLDRNEIIFLSSGALCRCWWCFLCCWCESERIFLWQHLLRRFTDCEQLGFSPSSTFWFSAFWCAQKCTWNERWREADVLIFPKTSLSDIFYRNRW